MVPVFIGQVVDGKVRPHKRVDFTRYLQTLAGVEVEIVVRKKPTKRSLDQNAYWWAVPVKLIADHCGYTPTQMHYALLGECFGYVDGPHGKPLPVKPSSSELTSDEFSQLITWVLDWAPSELGVYVPSPEQVAA